MKINLSTVYLVLFVLGSLAAGILTGIYGNDMGIYISYSFLGAYGIMIMVNAVRTEKIASVKVESYDSKEELTPEQIKELPKELGEGEGKKVGETTLETVDVSDEMDPVIEPEPSPEPVKEEPKKVQLTEEQVKMANNIISYVDENLKKGHKLDKIKSNLIKIYTEEFVDFVLKSTVAKEPELPDMGEPEEEVTPETLKAEVKKTKKKPGRPKKTKQAEKIEPEEKAEKNPKVEIVNKDHFE